MKNSANLALNAEQPQQDMASALVINNSTDLNGQASAAASVAQPSACLPTATPDVNAGSPSEDKTEKALDCFTKMSN